MAASCDLIGPIEAVASALHLFQLLFVLCAEPPAVPESILWICFSAQSQQSAVRIPSLSASAGSFLPVFPVVFALQFSHFPK